MNAEKREHYISEFQTILDLRDLSDGTINNYLSYFIEFLNWLEFHYGDPDPAEIEFSDIRNYISYLKNIYRTPFGTPLSPRSINPRIAQLHDFYAYVLHKVWDRYQIPYLKYQTFIPEVPSTREAMEFIFSLKNLKHKAIMAVIFSAGLRVSEAVSLKYSDIYLSRGYILVRAAKNRSERKAILSPRALQIIIEHWRNEGRPSEGYIFPGDAPGTHLSDETVRAFVRSHLKKLGWTYNYTPHSFRHSFALALLQNGTDLMTIRYALGHKSFSSTSVYLSLNAGEGLEYKSPFDVEKLPS